MDVDSHGKQEILLKLKVLELFLWALNKSGFYVYRQITSSCAYFDTNIYG